MKKDFCPVNCEVVVNWEDFHEADALLIEAAPVTGKETTFKRIPLDFPLKRPYQKWISFGLDSPEMYTLYKEPTFMDKVNMNVSFRADSQVRVSFNCDWGGGDYAFNGMWYCVCLDFWLYFDW